MNRLTNRKVTLSITIIGLIMLVSSIRCILAHDGHTHYQTEPKSTKIEEENKPSSSTPEVKDSEETENKMINVTLQKADQFSLIPQPSEIIFFLLVANPIVLKMIKQKL